MIKHVLLLCDGRDVDTTAEDRVHWKKVIPKLADAEIIQDFQLIASQGTKKLFYCLVEKDERWPRIRQWIQDHPLEGIQWWIGNNAEDMWKELWQNNRLIAKKVLKYRVETLCEGEPCRKTVTVEDAEDVYGETVVPANILPPIKLHGA